MPAREKILAASCLLLGSCGYPGPVLPPYLDQPAQIQYVNAIEYGDKILVQFTQQDLTTEGRQLVSVRSMDVGVGPGVSPFSTDAWAKTAKAYPIDSPVPGPVTKEIPVADFLPANSSSREVLVSARAVGPKGHASPWTTPHLLNLQQPIPTPTDLQALNVEAGVKLTWKGAAPKYIIFRSIAEATPERLSESDHPEFTDDSTQYGAQYSYRVQGITDESHTSVVTEAVTITPKDIFPPAVPGALTAILGVNTIELAWTRNSERDFKGYNVYRSTDGGPFVKIAGLIPTPTYSDTNIEAGKKYRYEVSAVDTSGNESAHSTPADASNQ